MLQVIKYKCCGAIYAACQEPDCYTEKEWIKHLKKSVKAGDIVQMIEPKTLEFGRCKCQNNG